MSASAETASNSSGQSPQEARFIEVSRLATPGARTVQRTNGSRVAFRGALCPNRDTRRDREASVEPGVAGSVLTSAVASGYASALADPTDP
jgi:hypothetical protein